MKRTWMFRKFKRIAVVPRDRGARRPVHIRSTQDRSQAQDDAGHKVQNSRLTPFPARLAAAILLLFACAHADVVRGAPIRVASLYLSPDSTSTKMGELDRGREVIVLETIRGWLHVEANMTEEKTITGWIEERYIVRSSTPNGDKILFGEAVDSEDQASQSHGRRAAAQDAMRLYYALAEYFPTSPFAGEAMYRSADIRWQIEKADVMTRPSAKEQDAFLREGMEEKYMKEVMKKFPGTKWADKAAFQLIDNKLCGDWQGASKCPEKEAEIYEKYASEHPQSPNTPEAMYDAAYRWSALIEIYKTEEQAKKSEQAKTKGVAAAQKVATQFPQTDWGVRCQRLLYYIEQGIPTYGNAD
jgi:outer membrane protein assembly factor BamD (BamD/ComL family)